MLERGYRVAQVDGSVADDERFKIRERFLMDRSEEQAIDILLFTEVGCEGLDYQFCDTMINYDLPWNPMRIEQRIGRIDRRGQKSETVRIYNFITDGTIDAVVYDRCRITNREFRLLDFALQNMDMSDVKKQRFLSTCMRVIEGR